MLQVIIIKENDKLTISELRDLETMTSLSVFDNEQKKIDLTPAKDYVGETILVTHFIRSGNCTRIDYERERTLTKVAEDNGLMYIEYN